MFDINVDLYFVGVKMYFVKVFIVFKKYRIMGIYIVIIFGGIGVVG